jgi:hypothetical protein
VVTFPSVFHELVCIANYYIEDECLAKFSSTGAPDEEHVDKPAKNTCAWLFDLSFQSWYEWRDSKDSGIMLLTGDIGTGKSTLARGAIDALRAHPPELGRSVSASFCSRGQVVPKYHEVILRGLLHGIAKDDEEAREVLVDFCCRNDRNYAKGENSQRIHRSRNFRGLFHRMR